MTWTGDRQRLSQVVTNLLTNAIRYNRDGGRVDIRSVRLPGDFHPDRKTNLV